jgi:hypothetical protein
MQNDKYQMQNGKCKMASHQSQFTDAEGGTIPLEQIVCAG